MGLLHGVSTVAKARARSLVDSAGRRTLCQPLNRVARSYEVIQQVPLTPETLTRFYVISAAGQPVPLSNLVTLKTAISGGKA
jgi:hypothetical protein